MPEETASWPSQLTFFWVTSLITLGNRKHLDAEDLWDVAEQDKTAALAQKMHTAWRAELEKPK